MEISSKKRTLDAYFVPSTKKARNEGPATGGPGTQTDVTRNDVSPSAFSEHRMYPFPLPHLPTSILSNLSSLPSADGKPMNDQADLDIIYFQPYIPKHLDRQLFQFLRSQLPFYRVEYKIKRGNVDTQVKTPRYTTVFGLDDTSRFDETGAVVDAATRSQVQKDKNYSKYPPRPIPQCLDFLRLNTEAATGCKFNFCLVNYYASGADSISYHSDDEHFLGPNPVIASFSLGAKRDFLMKHKPFAMHDNAPRPPETTPIKLALASGDMILMRGRTQVNWLHSIPKRSGKNLDDGGRINITFRKAMVSAGTENYYNYNVGTGSVYKWDELAGDMRLWN